MVIKYEISLPKQHSRMQFFKIVLLMVANHGVLMDLKDSHQAYLLILLREFDAGNEKF